MRSVHRHLPGERRRRRNLAARSEGGEGNHGGVWGRKGTGSPCLCERWKKNPSLKWRLDTLRRGAGGFHRPREMTPFSHLPLRVAEARPGLTHSLSWGALGAPSPSAPQGDAFGGRVKVVVAGEGCGEP